MTLNQGWFPSRSRNPWLMSHPALLERFQPISQRFIMLAMLQPRLLGIMQVELKAQNLELSLYCIQQIEKLVGQGIQRMHINSAVGHGGYVMQAERNLRLLIKHLTDYSRSLGTFPNLNDSDFDTALNVCPTLWPYRTSS